MSIAMKAQGHSWNETLLCQPGYILGKKRNKDNLALALQVAERERAGDETPWYRLSDPGAINIGEVQERGSSPGDGPKDETSPV